jgi:hypothetical protein
VDARGTKSLTLSLGLSNAWGWRPRFERKALQLPVAADKLGHVQNFVLVLGPVALTLSLSSVKAVGAIVTAPATASVLVDPRGRAL